jgi:PIN domain nuclease of toxin-antitoxin system
MALGKLERPAPPGFAGSLSEWLRQAGYRVMPMTRDACDRANALPMHHKDPMDRMLIAAALDRGMAVMTDDDVFAQYGVSTLW